MRALRIIAKTIGWIALSALLLVVSTLLTVVILGRTEWGHHKILSIALPQIQKQLAGHLHIGRIGGDLTHGLTLYDVELYDVEDKPAVKVAALTVRYNLLGLTHHTIDLTELKAEQAWVHARVLHDGKLNLATLAKPKEQPAKPKDPNAPSYKIRLGHVWLDLEARYDQPAAAGKPAQTAHADAHLEAHALVDGAKIDVGIDRLEAQTLSPLRAVLAARGGAHFDDGAISAHELTLTVDTDGAELRKLVPSVKLRGKWSVALEANGPADKLAVSLVARPPAGKLSVDAQLHSVAARPGQPPASAEELGWSVVVDGDGIDPGAAVSGAPRGTVRLDATGHGRGANGVIDLKGLVASVAGTQLDAHGHFDTAGDVNVMANIASRDLSKLRAVGIKDLAGSLQARTRVEKTASHLHVDADVSAQQLAVAANRVGKLDVHVHEKDFLGEAHVTLAAVKASGILLDTVKLDASGSPKAVAATLAARGPQKTSLDLVAHGTPTTVRHGSGVKITGADVVIDKLAMSRFDQAWATRGPATLRVHDGIDLQKLELGSGAQSLGLDARYDLKSGVVAANVRAQKLNVRQLAHLAKPDLDLPDTQLAIDAHLRGRKDQPIAEIKLDGFSERSQRLGLNRITYKLDGRYGDDRAKAEFVISALDESVKGKLDVPTVLTGNRPLFVDVAASNIWVVKLRKVLPARMANLDGRLDGSIKASGTTQRPVLSLILHGKRWQLDDESKNNDVQLKVDYQNKRLAARADVHLMQSATKDAGALSAQVAVPIDASLAKLKDSKRLMEQLEHKTPIAALITIKSFDVARFPFSQLGMDPPLTAGLIDGSIKLHGTLHEPVFDADLEGKGLGKGKVDKIDLIADVDYQNKLAKLKLDANLRGAPILRVRGETPVDFQRIIDHLPYQQTPLKVDAEVPGFNLVRVQDLVPKIEGALNAKAEVRGTIGKPTGKLDLAIAALNLGSMKYDKFEAHANYDGAQTTAKLDAHEIKGGRLTADATLPLDATKPVAAALRANGFYIDVEDVSLTNPRLVKGTLNASLDVSGPRANPTVAGFLRFTDGQLAIAGDARLYKDIKVDVAIQPGRLALKDLEATVGEGGVMANGEAKLKGLKPEVADLRIYARKFPIPTGEFGAWLDADVAVHGEDNGEGMTGTVTVTKGTASLPKLTGGKKLQSTSPLADVKFVDPAAKRAEAKRKAALQSAPTTEIAANIPGPFHVRSKELSTDLKGQLQIEIAGPVARISGQVESLGGWIELLGRRYELAKLRVGFGGEAEPDPELDVRLTRQLARTTLVIEVHGTAKKPQLILSSDPPIYDQSEVIAAILSGDPGSQRVDDRSLDQKVTGAVSSLVVGKIKDQIAPNLPIDVIKVDTGSEGSTGLGDTRLEVGKYITDNIYVSYVHQFGATLVGTQRVNSNEADLDWRFKKHYDLETAFGDAAVGRVNLFWTIRY